MEKHCWKSWPKATNKAKSEIAGAIVEISISLVMSLIRLDSDDAEAVEKKKKKNNEEYRRAYVEKTSLCVAA